MREDHGSQCYLHGAWISSEKNSVSDFSFDNDDWMKKRYSLKLLVIFVKT